MGLVLENRFSAVYEYEIRHTCAGRYPQIKIWIPAFAGMTIAKNHIFFGTTNARI